MALLIDAQHRMLAGLISGVTFKSYVVTEIEPIPNLFAYIDNVRVRTAPAALQTAGLQRRVFAHHQVLKLGEEVKHGVFNPTGASRLARMSPADALRLVANYPNAQRASRSTMSDWYEVVE